MSAVVVDMSHLYYRFIFANKDKIIENPEFSAHLLLNAVFNIKSKFHCTKEEPLYIALDNKTRRSWRYDFYEENSKKFDAYKGMIYKGNRTKDVTMPWKHLSKVYDELQDLLREGTDAIVLQHEKAEADDIIYVVAHLREKAEKDTIIVSSDKDFKQLISKHVMMYDPLKHNFIEIDDPKELLITDILTGQGRKDNILPCGKRLGKKTAEKMVHNIVGFLASDEQLNERYQFNRILIDLSEVPDWIQEEIIEQLGEKHFNYNFGKMLQFCQKYRLSKVAERIDELKLPSYKQEEPGGMFDL